MIIQTRRNDRFATVLRGELVAIDATTDGHTPLLCRGAKRETGEQYEFRVLLTSDEIRLLTREKMRTSKAA